MVVVKTLFTNSEFSEGLPSNTNGLKSREDDSSVSGANIGEALHDTGPNGRDEVKNDSEDSLESQVDSYCEIVVNFRCKFCKFVADDRFAIKDHVAKVHSNQNSSKAVISEEETSVRKAGTLDQNDSLLLEKPAENCEESANAEKDEVFFCSQCNIFFSSAEVCTNHIITTHNLLEFTPDLIRESPLSSRKLPEEQKRKRKRCLKQGQSFASKIAKRSPISEYMCELCKAKFKSMAALEVHQKCHITNRLDGDQVTHCHKNNFGRNYGKSYICSYCEPNKTERFESWGKCSYHLWKEHQIDCGLYACSVCQYKTPIQAKVKEHEHIHSSEAKFTCTTCKKVFKQFKQLKTHEKYHKTNQTILPPPSESRWYTPKECPICNRILSDSKCLKKHISAVHNKMKPYVCNICGHSSARKAELQLHVRQHTGEKPYKCPVCPFSTGDHNSLRKHKQRHVDYKPYACPHCDYSAIQSHAFKKHVLAVHPGQEGVFICPLCPLVSVNEIAFEAHRKDHQEGRIFNDNHNERPDAEKTIISRNSGNICMDEGTQGSNESAESAVDKSRAKFWLRDEDSNEVVDTGGITIPASESAKDCLETTSRREIVSQASLCSSIELAGDVKGSVDDINKLNNDFYVKNQASGASTDTSEDKLGESIRLLANKTSTAEGKDDLLEVSRSRSSNQDSSENNTDSITLTSSCNEVESHEKLCMGLSSESATFGPVDESKAISMVTELLAEGDCSTLNQFLLDPLLNDSTDLPDLLCEHSNDGTLEKLLNINVSGFIDK